MKRSFIIISILALMLFAAACSKNKVAETPKPEAPQHGASEKPQTPHVCKNSFGFRLWEYENAPEQNLLYSPFSINTAMGMVYTGARGNTADEMAKVMGYKANPKEQHESFSKSIESIQDIGSRKVAELFTANGLFSADSNKAQMHQDYLNILQKSFDSEITYLDFGKARESAEYINQWVEKNTKERIRDIVSERQIASSGDGLVLVNSIYFKSPWRYQFNRKETREDKFYTSSSRKDFITLPLMHIVENYLYGEAEAAQVLEMPFEESELSMVIVLPKEIDKLEFDDKNWHQWMDSLGKPRKVEVFLPRFRLESTLDKLPETFRKMGMVDAFDAGKADLSGIMRLGKENLYISDIVHKAFLEVLEEGTEAAAATQVGIAKMSYTPEQQPIPVFRVDKPFFLAILNKQSDEILFVAKVIKPEAAKE